MKDKSCAEWLYSRRIAHRGLHNDNAPENSMPAFKNAVDNGFNIETDLHILKDGKIALFHDQSLKRICGADIKLSELSSADLKNYKLGASGETIPLLEDLLSIANGKTGLLLEFKTFSFNGRLEEAALPLLKEYAGQFAVQAFNPYTILWFKKHAPEMYRGQLAAFAEGNAVSTLERIVATALKSLRFRRLNKPDFIAYCIKDLPNKYVDATKADGLPALAWTVKTREELKLALDYCDNYIFEGFVPE